MGLFSAKKKNENDEMTVQTCVTNTYSHPFLSLEGYSPYVKKQHELYKTLREAVPVIDAALLKITRLIGTFDVECSTKEATESLRRFLCDVKVNNSSNGIMQFLYVYLDQMLTYGTAVSEIVMSKDNTRISALYNADLSDIELVKDDKTLDTKIYVNNRDGSKTLVQHPERLCIGVMNPQPSEVYGTSVLKGLPYISSILLKIFNTIGVNFERVGNVRFAVNYRPDKAEGVSTKKRVQEIADQWGKAMRDKTSVCDFVSVGDVSVKVIGADSQVLSCDIEIKHLLEQIVSKLSIPPFLLGFSWSSTERMSSVQADILTSELEFYRTLLNPAIRKICRCYLRMSGYCDDFFINWSNINLQDETQLAQARLDNARAMQIESELSEVKN